MPAGAIEGDPEVLEKARHAEETGNGQVLLKACPHGRPGASRQVKNDIVQPNVHNTAYPLRGSSFPGHKIDSHHFGKTRIEDTPVGARVNDPLHGDAFAPVR